MGSSQSICLSHHRGNQAPRVLSGTPLRSESSEVRARRSLVGEPQTQAPMKVPDYWPTQLFCSLSVACIRDASSAHSCCIDLSISVGIITYEHSSSRDLRSQNGQTHRIRRTAEARSRRLISSTWLRSRPSAVQHERPERLHADGNVGVGSPPPSSPGYDHWLGRLGCDVRSPRERTFKRLLPRTVGLGSLTAAVCLHVDGSTKATQHHGRESIFVTSHQHSGQPFISQRRPRRRPCMTFVLAADKLW